MTELAPDNKLFENTSGRNPYAPDNNMDIGQFKIPVGITDGGFDRHGQILGDKLDLLFDYTSFGDSTGIIKESDGSLVFKDNLKQIFINGFKYNLVTQRIEEFEKCVDDSSIQLKKFPGDNPTDEYPLGLCEGGKFILL